MNRFKLLSFLLAFTLLSGCEYGPNTGKGFSLPEGDVTRGKATFVSLGCNNCHSISDIDQLPSADVDQPRVRLGGTVSQVKTYGDLVTSVINPSHKVAKRLNQGAVMSEEGNSMMKNYNDVMTVTQLVDLVTFLEDNYEVVVYPKTSYRSYYGP